MKQLLIILIMFFGLPVIAITDYAIFGKMLKLVKCKKCGADNSEWYGWFIACILESLFFISGVMLGLGLK